MSSNSSGNETLDFRLCFRSEFHVHVPCSGAAAKDVMPSPYAATGRPLKALPMDPSCQNHREPLARFPFAPGRFHPAAASPSTVAAPFVAALQSISLDRPRQGPPARKFFRSFVRRLSRNAFNLNHLGASVKGRFSKFLLPRPPAARTGDSPKGYQPSNPPSTPDREVQSVWPRRGA